MSPLEIGLLLRPLVALLVIGLIALPIRLAIQKWMPPGRLKSFLLLPLRERVPGTRGRQVLH